MGEAGSIDDNFQSKKFRAATRSQRNGLSELHWFQFKDVFIKTGELFSGIEWMR